MLEISIPEEYSAEIADKGEQLKQFLKKPQEDVMEKYL